MSAQSDRLLFVVLVSGRHVTGYGETDEAGNVFMKNPVFIDGWRMKPVLGFSKATGENSILILRTQYIHVGESNEELRAEYDKYLRRRWSAVTGFDPRQRKKTERNFI